MKTVCFTIDGKEIIAPEGQNLLWAALDNDIYIPNLCSLREASEPPASCRLCFVDIAGRGEPVTACTELVKENLVVNTRGTAALGLARTSFELLLASNQVDCAYCPKNRACELQKIAAHLGVKLNSKRFRRLERDLPVDDSCALFTYNPNKCVLCGRCVWVCRERLHIGAIGFAYRGFQRMVTTFDNLPLAQSKCQQCGECVKYCPTGALFFKVPSNS